MLQTALVLTAFCVLFVQGNPLTETLRPLLQQQQQLERRTDPQMMVQRVVSGIPLSQWSCFHYLNYDRKAASDRAMLQKWSPLSGYYESAWSKMTPSRSA
ncbi:hypothetical protein BV898_18296 [Hypsibius exemplaris]|uniref:Uncharacterized protein n=1 Tax=Hypsibius exemplaris TaxID=2072580 RepID=A0A9X6NGZ0_HYPEX|nr:hypothetical protein BV898_18296 [Hypsibius exemplaris]